jgi:hypothetical protein
MESSPSVAEYFADEDRFARTLRQCGTRRRELRENAENFVKRGFRMRILP